MQSNWRKLVYLGVPWYIKGRKINEKQLRCQNAGRKGTGTIVCDLLQQMNVCQISENGCV